MCGGDDGLKARAAQPVDVERRRGLGHPGLKGDMPSQVGRVSGSLLHVADGHGTHNLRRHIPGSERCARRVHSQLGGRQTLELAAEGTEGRPLRRHNE
jgi:hypothetical protein